MEEFLRKLEDILELDAGALEADTTLESIGWDSLSALTCLVMLEEEYGINATNDDLTDIETVGGIHKRFAIAKP